MSLEEFASGEDEIELDELAKSFKTRENVDLLLTDPHRRQHAKI